MGRWVEKGMYSALSFPPILRNLHPASRTKTRRAVPLPASRAGSTVSWILGDGPLGDQSMTDIPCGVPMLSMMRTLQRHPFHHSHLSASNRPSEAAALQAGLVR